MVKFKPSPKKNKLLITGISDDSSENKSYKISDIHSVKIEFFDDSESDAGIQFYF